MDQRANPETKRYNTLLKVQDGDSEFLSTGSQFLTFQSITMEIYIIIKKSITMVTMVTYSRVKKLQPVALEGTELSHKISCFKLENFTLNF